MLFFMTFVLVNKMGWILRPCIALAAFFGVFRQQVSRGHVSREHVSRETSFGHPAPSHRPFVFHVKQPRPSFSFSPAPLPAGSLQKAPGNE